MRSDEFFEALAALVLVAVMIAFAAWLLDACAALPR